MTHPLHAVHGIDTGSPPFVCLGQQIPALSEHLDGIEIHRNVIRFFLTELVVSNEQLAVLLLKSYITDNGDIWLVPHNPDFETIRVTEENGTIRTMSNEQGEPMFCAKDVALGYKRPEDAMAQHLEIEDSVKHRVMDRNGKLRVTTFINESGLYSLILSSKLESAKRFKRWVTGEVLPAIRKQGGYMIAKEGKRTSFRQRTLWATPSSAGCWQP